MIQLYTHENRQVLSEYAGLYIAKRVEEDPSLSLGGATGSSPKSMYGFMRENGDFSKTKILFLDEYFAKDSYRQYAIRHLHENFEDKSRAFEKENLVVPRGIWYHDWSDKVVTPDGLDKILRENTADYELIGPEIRIKEDCRDPLLSRIGEYCSRFERQLPAHRIQILGIGVEGHIGFNEKGTKKDSLTHLTRLADSTMQANADDFKDGEVTWYAVTQGTTSILGAEELLLLAFGEAKQSAVRNMLLGEQSPENPASYIRDHNNVRGYIDSAAFEGARKEGALKAIDSIICLQKTEEIPSNAGEKRPEAKAVSFSDEYDGEPPIRYKRFKQY